MVEVMYHVKELFYTLQGEGRNTGRAAVFCRFSGCNLWSGREQDRADAICRFCDTDFVGTDGVGGGSFESAQELAGAVAATWRGRPVLAALKPFVVCTGGEPLLQLDSVLIDRLHERGFQVAIETNGTIEVPEGIDWVCVSPKAASPLIVTRGNELKLIYPQPGAEPERYQDFAFDDFYLQPMDGPARLENTQAAVEYCLENPRWRLSLQTHKYLGIP